MTQDKLEIAIYQQDIAWHNPEGNYRRVEQAVATMGHPVDMIVLPETFNTGFGGDMRSLAEEAEGPTLEFVKRMAAQYDAAFVGTWLVRYDDEVRNRMHIVYPDGRYNIYDKLHTFRMSSEYEQVARGHCSASFEWKGWNIKPAICYDLRFPLSLRNRYNDNALDYDVLLLCANWPASRIAAWDTLLKARAIENVGYVVAANRTGVDESGLVYNGHSQVIDFKGNRVDNGGDASQPLLCATLSKSELDDFRKRWPFYLDADRFSILG